MAADRVYISRHPVERDAYSRAKCDRVPNVGADESFPSDDHPLPHPQADGYVGADSCTYNSLHFNAHSHPKPDAIANL